jgi:phosphoglycerol transferase MdoB-like AlkP superfamily enzyme
LAERSLFFTKGIANARRSVDGICAVLAGMPAWSDESFISSVALNSDFGGIGNLLKPKGYHSAFFHGGNNGTMFFDIFAARAGFDDYYGASEFADHSQHDGVWGIYDEPFLQFAVHKMSSFKVPFVSSIFTLSSHNPYNIPNQYKHRFPTGTLAIHESVGYTDYALRRFFETAQKQSWYANTLFVITGDHAFFETTRPEFLNEVGKSRVPILFFHPSVRFPNVNTDKFVQQIDIVPSILDYLGLSDTPHLLLGKSVFAEGPRVAMHAESEADYWLFRDDYFLHYLRSGRPHLYRWSDPGEHNEVQQNQALTAELQTQVEANLQYYSHLLRTTNLRASPSRSLANE